MENLLDKLQRVKNGKHTDQDILDLSSALFKVQEVEVQESKRELLDVGLDNLKDLFDRMSSIGSAIGNPRTGVTEFIRLSNEKIDVRQKFEKLIRLLKSKI